MCLAKKTACLHPPHQVPPIPENLGLARHLLKGHLGRAPATMYHTVIPRTLGGMRKVSCLGLARPHLGGTAQGHCLLTQDKPDWGGAGMLFVELLVPRPARRLPPVQSQDGVAGHSPPKEPPLQPA